MRYRLSLMMALVYAVQGAFWPLLAVHLKDLGVDGPERGWIFATLAIACLAMPMGAGQLVDRFFASQKLLALIFAAATGFLIVLATGLATDARSLFLLFLTFWLVTAPVFTLANAISLRHLARPHQEFPSVRLWGTVGWMGVGWLVSFVMAVSGSVREGQGAYEAFWISAVISAGLAVYCLTLPHTPPLATDPGTRAGLFEALSIARKPGMTVLLVTALGVHMTTPFVYQVLPTYLESRGLPRSWISTMMTIGQFPEVAMLALLPRLLDRFGPKVTLALGVGSWVVRFGSLSLDPPLWLAIAGMPLQGMGIACFTVAAQMYTDGRASRHQRASAQALYMVVTSGFGSLLGSLLSGNIVERYSGDYRWVFLVPCVIDGALLVYFYAGFRPSAKFEEHAGGPNAARPSRDDAVRGSVKRVGNLVTESADG